jgi:hypothetical protein
MTYSLKYAKHKIYQNIQECIIGLFQYRPSLKLPYMVTTLTIIYMIYGIVKHNSDTLRPVAFFIQICLYKQLLALPCVTSQELDANNESKIIHSQMPQIIKSKANHPLVAFDQCIVVSNAAKIYP